MLFFVAYTHCYGTDVCAYPNEDLAYKGACKIIADWFDDLDFFDDERVDELRDLINTGSYFRAVVLWNEFSGDCDLQESITVTCSELVTEVETPFIKDESTEQEEDSE
jgi:hypothetical protein